VKKDGTLWAWGHNYVGQLGLGDTTTRLTPTRVGASNDYWASVSCGDGDTLAVKTNGTLWAWGFNGNGELGLGDTKERHTPTEVGSGSP
jgi:alpha-tubulin suppressor-like RCC1 family protein